jgi:hypothetical protein
MLRFNQHRLDKELVARGTPAKAEVLAARPTLNNVTNSAHTRIIAAKWRLTVRVLPDGEPPFEVECKPWLEGSIRPVAGQIRDVLYDPSDHSRLIIDPRVLDPMTEAIAAARAQAVAAGPGVFVLSGSGLARVGGAPAVIDPAAAAPAAALDVDELQKLADLHTRGALSDDEFATLKARILGG